MPKKKHISPINNQLIGPLSLLVFAFLLYLAASNIHIFSFAAKGGGKGSGGGAGKPDQNPTQSINPTPTPQPGNLLTNTSFEEYTGKEKTPTTWVQHYDQPNKLAKTVCNLSHSGNCSYYMDGKKATALKQYVTYSAPAGSTITVSGWSKSDVAEDNTNASTGSYWVQAWIHYTDGSTEWGLHADFDKNTHDWQYKTNSFTVQKPVEGFTYFVKFDSTGFVWFDDISLTVN